MYFLCQKSIKILFLYKLLLDFIAVWNLTTFFKCLHISVFYINYISNVACEVKYYISKIYFIKYFFNSLAFFIFLTSKKKKYFYERAIEE